MKGDKHSFNHLTCLITHSWKAKWCKDMATFPGTGRTCKRTAMVVLKLFLVCKFLKALTEVPLIITFSSSAGHALDPQKSAANWFPFRYESHVNPKCFQHAGHAALDCSVTCFALNVSTVGHVKFSGYEASQRENISYCYERNFRI